MVSTLSGTDRCGFLGIRSALRQADWLHAARARGWCRVLGLVSLGGAIAWIALSHHGRDLLGKPLGTDFLSFWAAARLALAGHIASVYDPAAHAAAERSLLPGETAYYAFFYPPTFLLICLPFAVLPYLGALTAWLTATFVPLYALLRRLLPQPWAILPILTFPGILVNAGHGQNGFLSAACLGGGMLLLDASPVLAGLCFGILVFKPHLLIAVPVALLAARRWRALAGLVAAAVGWCAASWIVLGTPSWLAFLRSAPLARMTLEHGLVPPWKMVSTFAALRLLHLPLSLAYATQAVVGVAVLGLVWRLAVRRPGGQAEGAMAIVGTLLCTPFLLDYDLVCLALPLAWLMRQALRSGWRPWEKVAMLLAYLLPLLARPLAEAFALPIAPLAIAGLLWVMAMRLRQTQSRSCEGAAGDGQAVAVR